MSHKVGATVDGIKFSYDGGEVEVTYDVSDSDVVRLTIEPLEVKVTDGFRAAVKKACKCDSSSGGGSGGGVLVVNVNSNGNTHTLNKTFAEILEAFTNTGVVLVKMYQGKCYHIVINTSADDEFNEYSVFINGDEGMQNFTTNTRTGYPVYTFRYA